MSILATSLHRRQASIVLRADDVWKSYDDGTITVLKGVDLEAAEGERKFATPQRAAVRYGQSG